MRRYTLVPHPAHPPSGSPFEVWATAEHSAAFGATATVNIWFGIGAPMTRFEVEAAGEGLRTHELWKTTCFEAFLKPHAGPAYREWNFAPSAAWQAYQFSDYREGMAEPPVAQPPYVRTEDNLSWWTLGATIGVEAGQSWMLGLSAVLEEIDGTKSFWALNHPTGERPDFHHPDCFAGRLP